MSDFGFFIAIRNVALHCLLVDILLLLLWSLL